MDDTREKLFDLMMRDPCPSPVICNPNCKYYKSHHCHAERYADHLIANGVTVQEWISVKDRFPEDICPVLVALEGLNIAFHGFYQDEKWWKVGAGTRPFTQKVTHWMPLPQPPKGE